MATIEKISIALPQEMVASVRQAVDAGEYASSSEVIRDWTLKRTLRRHGVEELREVWQQAMQDETPGIPADEVFNRLERKYSQIANREHIAG